MLSGSNSFANPLPGVPAVESPFFERIFTESLYSEETLRIARDLHDTGYAVLDFPDNSIGEIADRIIADLRGSYDWQGWQNGKYNDLRIADGWRVNQDVHCIAANPCIIDLLSVLYGRRAFPFQTLNFAVGTQQHVHSDSVHFSSNPERFMCGVWVALEDVDLDTGPLLYYPGSHKWPIYTNEHIGVDSARSGDPYQHYPVYEGMWRQLIDVHRAQPERFCARKGQALIWTANLLHGGDKMRDLDRTRWSQVTHYYFEGCSYYTPMISEVFQGSIFFRDLCDAGSGTPVPHSVSGRAVDPRFVAEATRRAAERLPIGFDGAVYLNLHPDVAAGGMDPAVHYVGHGRHEGRRWR